MVDNRPVTNIREYLNDAEQEYLQSNFSERHYNFPRHGGDKRAHALAALCRSEFESLLYASLRHHDRLIGIGCNFFRHYKHNRNNVISYCLNDNATDLDRNLGRIQRVESLHPTQPRRAEEYLANNVVFYDGLHPLPEHQHSPIGIAIHSLYDITPDHLYHLMSNFGMDELYGLLNIYDVSGKMYAGSVTWTKHADGQYIQRSTNDGTSVYQHTQDPALYRNLKFIRGPTHTIIIRVHEERADQVVLKFRRVHNDDVPSDFDDVVPIPNGRDEWIIKVPTVVGIFGDHPIHAYKDVHFTPNRMATKRVETAIFRDHPHDLNPIDAIFNKYDDINMRTIIENDKVRKRIDMDVDDIILHTLFSLTNHRRHVITRNIASVGTNTKLTAYYNLDWLQRAWIYFIQPFVVFNWFGNSNWWASSVAFLTHAGNPTNNDLHHQVLEAVNKESCTHSVLGEPIVRATPPVPAGPGPNAMPYGYDSSGDDSQIIHHPRRRALPNRHHRPASPANRDDSSDSNTSQDSSDSESSASSDDGIPELATDYFFDQEEVNQDPGNNTLQHEAVFPKLG